VTAPYFFFSAFPLRSALVFCFSQIGSVFLSLLLFCLAFRFGSSFEPVRAFLRDLPSFAAFFPLGFGQAESGGSPFLF